MKFILQILFLILSWFTNLVNATPVFAKIVLPNCELVFSKTENHFEKSTFKAALQKLATSGNKTAKEMLEVEYELVKVGEKEFKNGGWWKLQGAGNTLGTIVKVGNKIEYTNPAGKLLKWTEQGANDIDNAILTAKNLDPLNTNNIGRITEGKVADFIKQEGKTVEGFGLTIKKVDNSVATDIDILTSNEIIEVKNSIAAWENKPNQVNRFVNSTLDDFVNPYNKKAILYIEKPLSSLDKAKILNTIPSNVTLVNSLNELKAVVK